MQSGRENNMADNNDMFNDSVPEGVEPAAGAQPAEGAGIPEMTAGGAPADTQFPGGQTVQTFDFSQQTSSQIQSDSSQFTQSVQPQTPAGGSAEPRSQMMNTSSLEGNGLGSGSAAGTAPAGGQNYGSAAGTAYAGTQGTAGSQTAVPEAKPIPKKKFSFKDWVPGPQVPNQLTIARICMIPLFVVFILWVPKPLGDILATITFIVASLTDTADGYIARRYNYVTTFGKFMDPLADKLLVCSALICLVDLGRIESWIVIIIIAREFIISGFRLVAADKGIVIAANFWGKIKTICQMVMVILMCADFGGILGMAAQVLKWVALALTLISLVTYMYKNRQVLQDNK